MSSVEPLTMKAVIDPDIQDLRQKVQSGTYRVPSDKIAEAMMTWHLGAESVSRPSSLKAVGPANRT